MYPSENIYLFSFPKICFHDCIHLSKICREMQPSSGKVNLSEKLVEVLLDLGSFTT
jgi:hypothetical protein